MTSKHHSIIPGWLRSSPGETSSPVSDRFGSPILARYLAMSVDGMCERMCIQNDSWAGESDFVRKMIRMSVERVVAMRRPCLRFEMARSLLAAVFFAEAFAMVAGGDRRCSRGKPSVILPPAAHEPHPRLVSAYAPSDKSAFSLSIAGLNSKREHATRKHAQLRTSLKVRRKVTHPLLPHTRVIPCGSVLLAHWRFDPSPPLVCFLGLSTSADCTLPLSPALCPNPNTSTPTAQSSNLPPSETLDTVLAGPGPNPPPTPILKRRTTISPSTMICSTSRSTRTGVR